jgi:hypothetical protein
MAVVLAAQRLGLPQVQQVRQVPWRVRQICHWECVVQLTCLPVKLELSAALRLLVAP